MRKLLLTFFGAIFFISACSKPAMLQPAHSMNAKQGGHSDDAIIKLTEAAASINDSLLQLSKIQTATSAVKKSSLTSAEIPGMHQIGSVDWSGPAQPLLAKIANATGFRLRVIGIKPQIPVMITLSVNNLPMSEIIRNIDYQAQSNKRASVTVYPNKNPKKRVIELRYAAS